MIDVAGDIAGGGTGREYKENLLNDGIESWNKWLHPGRITSSWIEYTFLDQMNYTQEVYPIVSYGVCSANDCPHRDPIAWTLEGFDSDRNDWIELHRVTANRGSPSVFDRRFQWHWYDIDQALAQRPCRGVRLKIDQVRRPGDCIQLSHFHVKTK